MKWLVKGASKSTGKDIAQVIEASSDQDAQNAAAALGIAWESVKPLPAGATSRPHDPVNVPDLPPYLGLTIASFIIGCVSTLCYIASLYLFAKEVEQAQLLPYADAALFFPSIAAIGLGAVLHGLSAGCLALRDIARKITSKT